MKKLGRILQKYNGKYYLIEHWGKRPYRGRKTTPRPGDIVYREGGTDVIT